MRAGIYARVSSDEQVDGFSLDAQRRAMLDFCATKEWNVEVEYIDEGKSARGDELSKRPAFQRMMADVSARRIDVVVVHKLDRFARNIRVTFEQFQILQRHRVLFASVSEQGFDFTTPMGQVILSVLAAFAQYYSDNLAAEVRKGKAERKAQGFTMGYCRSVSRRTRPEYPSPIRQPTRDCCSPSRRQPRVPPIAKSQ